MARMRVALTFDAEHPDRPGCPPEVPGSILQVLADLEVRATFFLQGRWAEAYPETARRIGRDGHLIGSHSFYHARMTLLSGEGLLLDVRAAEHAIRETTGVDPRPWFRCPWGAGADDARILATLERCGFRHAGWDVIAEDWEPHRTAAEVESATTGGALEHGDGAIALLHAWPAATLAALPRIVDRLRGHGAELVTIDQLGRDPGTTANPPNGSR